MANVRIKDITTTASVPNDDDYLAIDGVTGGTRKILADSVGGKAGGITVVDHVSEMTDQELVYLYNGTETGYTAGHWYYYDTGTHSWTDGGQYSGWETVDTAVAEYLQANAQPMAKLTVVVGANTYEFNGSADVSITLPVYSGGVS